MTLRSGGAAGLIHSIGGARVSTRIVQQQPGSPWPLRQTPRRSVGGALCPDRADGGHATILPGRTFNCHTHPTAVRADHHHVVPGGAPAQTKASATLETAGSTRQCHPGSRRAPQKVECPKRQENNPGKSERHGVAVIHAHAGPTSKTSHEGPPYHRSVPARSQKTACSRRNQSATARCHRPPTSRMTPAAASAAWRLIVAARQPITVIMVGPPSPRPGGGDHGLPTKVDPGHVRVQPATGHRIVPTGTTGTTRPRPGEAALRGPDLVRVTAGVRGGDLVRHRRAGHGRGHLAERPR